MNGRSQPRIAGSWAERGYTARQQISYKWQRRQQKAGEQQDGSKRMRIAKQDAIPMETTLDREERDRERGELSMVIEK